MTKIYAMSDIHGMINLFRDRLSQVNMDEIRSGKARLILLGDYIDVGTSSFKVLETIYNLKKDLKDNLIVLMGNHDNWFLEFLDDDLPNWNFEDYIFSFLDEFLTEKELRKVEIYLSYHKIKHARDIIKAALAERHSDLLRWYRSLPHYYETDKQIFVHAGIIEKSGDDWKYETDDFTYLEKYPAQTGAFHKHIVAGHVSVTEISGQHDLHDIYWDGQSHFYIDGIDSYPLSTPEGERYLPLLLYTDENNTDRYYSIKPDGTKEQIRS